MARCQEVLEMGFVVRTKVQKSNIIARSPSCQACGEMSKSIARNPSCQASGEMSKIIARISETLEDTNQVIRSCTSTKGQTMQWQNEKGQNGKRETIDKTLYIKLEHI